MFANDLKEFARMSQTAGARADYAQGGGGNTSVKLDGGLMAIKASGYRLRQVTESDGFAVVETATLKDITEQQGYKPLRPSVEAGFHAAMPGKFVLHTHPIYANLALCSKGGTDRLPEIMGGYSYIIVPYVDPGPTLAGIIRQNLKPDTQAVFMINHGLVVTADTADECLKIHSDINMRIARAYSVTAGDFADFAENMNKTLYPDHQVYLKLTETQMETMTAVMFIQFTLMKNGLQAQSMDERSIGFIAGWEVEDYRKSVLS